MTVKQKVLVVGGGGYIGSHTVDALLKAGHSPVVLDDMSSGSADMVPDGVPVIVGDAGDVELVKKTLIQHDVEAVIHFAGSIIVSESMDHPLKYYQNNTSVSRNLLEAVVEYGIRSFVFSSTAAVYGVPDIVPIPEAEVRKPISPYGKSKLATEWMLEDVGEAHGVNQAVLRYFNVAGADPSGARGQGSKIITHLIKIACQAAVGLRDGVEIFGEDYDTPDGTCIRDYVHVCDLADAHVTALEYISRGKDIIANCGYGRGYSVKEVLAAVEDVSGKKLNISIGKPRKGDPPILCADNKRITEELQWSPKYDDLNYIIETALKWEASLAKNGNR